MKHIIEHDVGIALARESAHKAFASYSQKFADYNPSVEWPDEDHATIGFKVKGVSLSGAVVIREREIELELNVPFFLKMFQSRAISIIDSEVREWLAKAKAGTL